MTTDDIKRDIESGALTSPIIVFERMLKAKLDWPSELELISAIGEMTEGDWRTVSLQCYRWLRKRLMGEGEK